MFYFASDNPLAPGIVSQLKAIKAAGFHKDANVIARFDPHTERTPTHVFDVNLIYKLKSKTRAQIGFTANDPFVRDLVQDKLWGHEVDSTGKVIRDALIESFKKRGVKYAPPIPVETKFAPQTGAAQLQPSIVPANRPTSEPSPRDSLKSFLQFCAKNYPAHHYMLFILGHGIVVGNDLFLFDEHAVPDHSLKLRDLGTILRDFARKDISEGKFELVSFHSCSMSGLEVAYELKDTAHYMLASEGPAFVGSWPYREILIRVFNDIKRYGAKINVREMVEKIFEYCFYNSYDFQLAGYSFDVSLTDLTQLKASGITDALETLSRRLVAGLPVPPLAGQQAPPPPAAELLARDLIIMSHLEAQSYFEENFTDLYDFCFSLRRRCQRVEKILKNNTPKTVSDLKHACDKVRRALAPQLIIRSGFAGPAYQYSHGLSIYFPWSVPAVSDMWENQYQNYKLMKDTNQSWRTFLNQYFSSTMRQAQDKERREAKLQVRALDNDARLLEEISRLVFNENGQLSISKDGSGDRTDKDHKNDPTGDDCECPSIKNYPPYTQEMPASPELLHHLKFF
jgi:hypothetical protein